MDHFKKELAGLRVEDYDRPVYRLSCQVTLEGFMNGHSVDIGVVHKPNDLI